tara:strand:+ start:71 stop:391 length:321 start_codon:yes stop_codon:yes gene_type:complete
MNKNVRIADKGKSFSWDSRMGGRVEHGSMYENEAKREAKKRKEKGLPPKKKRKTEYENYLEHGLPSKKKGKTEYDNYLESKKKKKSGIRSFKPKKPVKGILESQGY